MQNFWLVTTEFPPTGGGIAPYAAYTAEMFANSEVSLTIIHHDFAHKGRTVTFLAPNVRLIRVGDNPTASVPLSEAALRSWSIAEALRSEFRKGLKPDVIEFQDFGAVAYFTLMNRSILDPDFVDVRVVLTAHRPMIHAISTDEASQFKLPTFFVGEMERWCLKAADAILFPCEFLQTRLRDPDMGFHWRKSFTVRNPFPKIHVDPAIIAPPDQHQAATQLPPTKVGREIVYVGKLQTQKGLPDVLKLLGPMWDNGFPHTLLAFGRDAWSEQHQGSMRNELEKRYATHIAAGKLTFMGGYNRDEIDTLFASGTIAVMPYREECMPYAVIEVIAAGGVPLVRAGGGQAELIPPELQNLLVYDGAIEGAFEKKLKSVMTLSSNAIDSISRSLKNFINSLASFENVLPGKISAITQVAANPIERGQFPYLRGPVKTRKDFIARPSKNLNNPSVSVVIPFFNMQDFIFETLNSILDQSYPVREIIIVDDGSNHPEAKKALGEISKTPLWKKVRIVSKPNGGLASARNYGAATATSDLLLFLDSDDLIDASFIMRCVEILLHYDNVLYASSWLEEFDGGSGQWATWPCEFPYLLYHSTQHCTILIWRDVWLAVGQNDERMRFGMEDYESFISMTAAGVRGLPICESLFKYRVRKDSMMREFNAEKTSYLYREISLKHRDLFNLFGAEIAQLTGENGHGMLCGDPTRSTDAARRLFELPGYDIGQLFSNTMATADVEAISQFRNLVLREPENAHALQAMGEVMLRFGTDIRSAREAFKAVLRSDAKNFWATVGLAECAARFGNEAESQELLGRGAALYDSWETHLMWLASDAMSRADFEVCVQIGQFLEANAGSSCGDSIRIIALAAGGSPAVPGSFEAAIRQATASGLSPASLEVAVFAFAMIKNSEEEATTSLRRILAGDFSPWTVYLGIERAISRALNYADAGLLAQVCRIWSATLRTQAPSAVGKLAIERAAALQARLSSPNPFGLDSAPGRLDLILEVIEKEDSDGDFAVRLLRKAVEPGRANFHPWTWHHLAKAADAAGEAALAKTALTRAIQLDLLGELPTGKRTRKTANAKELSKKGQQTKESRAALEESVSKVN